MESPSDRHIVAFICGLHRSGTTPLAHWLSGHPDISAFRNTGVNMDEGQFLQTVYPPALHHGGPGRFAFDPEAHLTEKSSIVSEENRLRLWAEWSSHWDLNRRVLLEKSPPNIIRTRFLQALFPDSRFIVIIRHPIGVAYATKRWSQTSLLSLLKHWVRAHERLLADAPSIRHLALIRYEDLVADPPKALAGLQEFLDLDPYDGSWEVRQDLNLAYFRRWDQRGIHRSVRRFPRYIAKKSYIAYLARRFEHRVRPFGYSFRAPYDSIPVAPPVARYLVGSPVREIDGTRSLSASRTDSPVSQTSDGTAL